MTHSVYVCICVYVHNYLWNTCGKGHFQLSFTMSVSLICVLIFIPPGTTIAQALILTSLDFCNSYCNAFLPPILNTTI